MKKMFMAATLTVLMIAGGCGASSQTAASSQAQTQAVSETQTQAASETQPVSETVSETDASETDEAVEAYSLDETDEAVEAYSLDETSEEESAELETVAGSEENLLAVLDEISDIQDGTAGSSLKMLQCASDLLDWAYNTDMTADQANVALEGYDDEMADQLSSVQELVQELEGDGAESMLSDIGADETSCYPWNDQAFELALSLTK